MERPTLTRMMRGYDPTQVDATLDAAWSALDGSPDERAHARELLAGTMFEVVMRGYDRRQVDDLVDDLVEHLGGGSASDAAVQAVTSSAHGRGSLGLITGILLLAPPELYRPGMPALPWLPWLLKGAVGALMLLWGGYLLLARLEWSDTTIAVVVGPWRRAVALPGLTEVTHRQARGGVDFVLRDDQGRKVVIDDSIFARRRDWKPLVLAAARAAGARFAVGTEWQLSRGGRDPR